METEAERLKNDAFSRERMSDHMKAVEEAEARGETGDRAAWKWKIRKRIWDYLEEHDLAANPRPVHHRIPNFVGSELTARQVEKLPEFHRASWIKINPDSPQKEVRAVTLRHGKMLLVPQPRLRTGFFSVLNPRYIEPQKISFAVTQQGVVTYGEPVGLDARIKVDMVVLGSVAVNPENGARIGKGEGFAELEYGMMRWMGAVDDDTPVVTCIHDCQLVSDIPSEKMLCHDVPVDIICTPTQIIRVKKSLPKPTGIYWEKLSPQKLASIRILQTLKAKIEAETRSKLPTGPSEVLPPTASRTGKGSAKGGRGQGDSAYSGRVADGSRGRGRGSGYKGSGESVAWDSSSWDGAGAAQDREHWETTSWYEADARATRRRWVRSVVANDVEGVANASQARRWRPRTNDAV